MPDERTSANEKQSAPRWFKVAHRAVCLGQPAFRYLRRTAATGGVLLFGCLVGFMAGMQAASNGALGCMVQLPDGTLYHYRSNGRVDKGHTSDLSSAQTLFLLLVPVCADARGT